MNDSVVPVAAEKLSPAARKARLREDMHHRRLVIPEDLKNTTRWKVINHLRELVAEVAPGTLALYYPRGEEIDISGLASELWRDGQRIALPRVAQKKRALTFNIWPPLGELEPDAVGIPAATGPEVTPDMLVVPMLGYTRKGYRLGSGGGYFDRTLATIPQPVVTVGVCYTELEIRDFPVEKHDIPLNYVVTGREVIVCP